MMQFPMTAEGELVRQIRPTDMSTVSLYDVSKLYHARTRGNCDLWLNNKHYLFSFDWAEGFLEEEVEKITIDEEVFSLAAEEEGDSELTIDMLVQACKMLVGFYLGSDDAIFAQLDMNPSSLEAAVAASSIRRNAQSIIKSERLDYVDNYRYAEKGNLEQEKKYRELKSKGCCGFYDTEMEVNGKTYLVGWNYGH